jgi:hypothetical protein
MAGCVAAKKIGKHAESFAARYGEKDAKSLTIRVRANRSFRLDPFSREPHRAWALLGANAIRVPAIFAGFHETPD